MEFYWDDNEYQWKPLTNYGFIVTRNPETLAEFLSKEFCNGCDQEGILAWLNSVKED